MLMSCGPTLEYYIFTTCTRKESVGAVAVVEDDVVVVVVAVKETHPPSFWGIKRPVGRRPTHSLRSDQPEKNSSK